MNGDALSLVLLGALLHTFWNVFAKKAAGGLAFTWLFGLVGIVLAGPVGVFLWMTTVPQLNGAAMLAVVASGLLHVVYLLALQRGYRESDFSVVYPLARGTGPLFSVLGAVCLLGELPSTWGWCGIVSILSGIFLISGLPSVFSNPTAKLKAGLFWGLSTGFCIAIYTVLDGWAVKNLAISPVLFYILGMAVRSIVLAPFALQQREELAVQWRTNTRYIVAIGVLSPLAYTLILLAMTKAPLSYVAPIREVSMLLGIVLGAQFLREAISPTRLIGAGCMVTGIVLLTQTV